MNGFEINKIVAAIIFGVLLVFGVGKFTDWLFYVETPTEPAYKMDVPTAKVVSAQSSGSESVDITKLLSLGTVEHGEKIFKKCSACHNYEKNSANKVGPNLWNIINRPKADINGFAYSKALSEFGGNWSYEELAKFLYKPKEYIIGNKMNFSGLKKVKDRADLVSFLREQSDNPTALP